MLDLKKANEIVKIKLYKSKKRNGDLPNTKLVPYAKKIINP